MVQPAASSRNGNTRGRPMGQGASACVPIGATGLAPMVICAPVGSASGTRRADGATHAARVWHL